MSNVSSKLEQRRSSQIKNRAIKPPGDFTAAFHALNKVATAVSQSLDLNATLATAMEAVLSVIPVEASGISLIDHHAGELVLRAQRGWKQDFVSQPMRIKLGHGLSGQVIMTGEVVITGDLHNDNRLVVPAVAEENIQAMAMAPMHARGAIIGILSVMSYRPYSFDELQITLLKAIADQVGVALDNARLFEAIREGEQRLLAVLQSTADAIISTDGRGCVNMINRAAEKLFDLSNELITGQPLEYVPFPPEIRSGLSRALITFEGAVKTFEVALSENRWLSAVISPIAFLSGVDESQAQGWVVVFQEITHIKQSERSRVQFIQAAAHDLRNPLGATLSALTMLQRTFKNPESLEGEVLGIALRGVNRMQDLIDDLLNLEKIESGLDFGMETLQIGDLVKRTATDMTPILARRNQQLTLEIASALPPLQGNAHWLSRALQNLISNAHKYGNESGQIVIRVLQRESEVVIPIESQIRLFERFYRVPETKDKVQGTGLGLSIVKSVIERHSGRVTVSSLPGQGATFALHLPILSG
jgi:two-component system phosphate regulon sensor histidine kinase PhoR